MPAGGANGPVVLWEYKQGNLIRSVALSWTPHQNFLTVQGAQEQFQQICPYLTPRQFMFEGKLGCAVQMVVIML